MPFYRVNGLMVHLNMRGKKAPAPCCGRISLAGIDTRCMAISQYLCDAELSDGKTCDAPLCDQHAKQVGKDRHLCPRHAAEHAKQVPELF